MHLWDLNNNRIIRTTGRLKKISTQDLNRKLMVQLIGEMKRSDNSRGEIEERPWERECFFE